MKLYINARFLLQKRTGVERYAYEMCRALKEIGADIHLICPQSGEINPTYDITGFNIVRFGWGRSHLWEQLILPFFFVRKKNYTVISFTGLGSILVPHKIMTIHDLSFLENPQWFSKAYYYYYKIMTPLAVRTSQHIVTVSEFSRNEIMHFYPFIHQEKITVIYNAAEERLFGTKKQNNTDKPFFLAVSSLDPRKNFDTLIKAFKGLPDYRLIIAGGKNRVFGTSDAIASTEECPSNIEFIGRVEDQKLSELYANARGYISPSLYEGFGLPLIEAMMSGCPVLCSDIPVYHEVCNNAALFFNPNSYKALQDVVQKFAANETSLRQHLIAQGFANSKRFSWHDSAKKLIDILKNL
ncbi:MAG: glycosyltransferase family 1 protein [Bacteroidales bacterium]|nr:glycosyltransferase family 1 protein [Bacteroidales bacterium]